MQRKKYQNIKDNHHHHIVINNSKKKRGSNKCGDGEDMNEWTYS